MKKIQLLFYTVCVVMIAACSAGKKSAASGSAPSGSTATIPASDDYLFNSKPPDGINPPGDAELTAMQAQYKELTLEKLKEGHAIYTGETCTRCHNAKSIYRLDEASWKTILDDMAQRAYLSEAQKDAVYKYVLSIKATQPN